MICQNGRQLAANCLQGREKEMIAARGFFKAFWRYSRAGCPASRRAATTSIHTQDAPIHKPTAAWRRAKLHPPRDDSPSSRPSTSVETSFSNPALSTSLRLLMRTLPHSIVVVTASKLRFDGTLLNAPTPSQSLKPTTPRDYRGMTVSSFTTITLSPEPIISFNVKFPSQTLEAIEHSRHFLVHVLEASEGGMRIADAFTRGNKHVEGLFAGYEKGVGVEEVKAATWFEGMFGLPMLRAQGVRRVLRCTVGNKLWGKKSGLVKAGDHMVVIATVEEILGEEREAEDGKMGLCYANGRYRKVGEVIEMQEDVIEEKKGAEE